MSDKVKNPVLLTPVCGDCGTQIIITTFENKVSRWICGGCNTVVYTIYIDGGLVRAKGYTVNE